MCLEIFCNRGDDFWRYSHEALIRMVKESLIFCKYGEIEDFVIERVQNAYPVYRVNFGKDVSIIMDYLARYKNLCLAGKSGTLKYLNMDNRIQERMKVSLAINNQK